MFEEGCETIFSLRLSLCTLAKGGPLNFRNLGTPSFLRISCSTDDSFLLVYSSASGASLDEDEGGVEDEDEDEGNEETGVGVGTDVGTGVSGNAGISDMSSLMASILVDWSFKTARRSFARSQFYVLGMLIKYYEHTFNCLVRAP